MVGSWEVSALVARNSLQHLPPDPRQWTSVQLARGAHLVRQDLGSFGFTSKKRDRETSGECEHHLARIAQALGQRACTVECGFRAGIDVTSSCDRDGTQAELQHQLLLIAFFRGRKRSKCRQRLNIMPLRFGQRAMLAFRSGYQPDVVDCLAGVSMGAGLPKMVGEIVGMVFERFRIDALDRVGNIKMQSLAPRY